jgi:tetratricopeptide (TPR) repeat protein
MIPVLLLFLILITQPFVYAQSDQTTYEAYLTTDPVQAETRWKAAIKKHANVLQEHHTPANQYALALAQFGLLSSTMRTKNESLFEEYADQTESNLKKLTKDAVYGAEAKALLAALYGLKLGYSPWKGMYLGPKSSSLMEAARKENPSAPLIWKLYGNSKLFTPQMFGGDVAVAIQAYEKAISLYEKNPSHCELNWFYIDTYAFLGQAYSKTGNAAKAVTVYERVLTLEPDFLWVKMHLLPSARKH